MATLTINFTVPTPAPANGYRVRYRIVGSGMPYTELFYPAGTLSPVTVPNLAAATSYEGTIESKCGETSFSQVLAWTADGVRWVADEVICEQDSLFTLEGEVTGLSSPMNVQYNSVDGLMHGVDADSVAGTFFRYSPVGFNNAAQISYVPMTLKIGAENFVYASVVDVEFQRSYACGKDTDGVQVFDMVTQTVSVITWGFNHNVPPIGGSSSVRNGYSRASLRGIGPSIIGVDKYSNDLIVINRATGQLNFITNLTAIPSYEKCLIGAPEMLLINNQYWVLSSQGNATEAPLKEPHIFIYNNSFTQLITTINLAAFSLQWSYGAYYRSVYYDTQNDKAYIFDCGACTLIVIDINTLNILNTQPLPVRQDKGFGSFSIVPDAITGELYLTGTYLTSVTDAGPLPMTYRLDRSTGRIDYIVGDTVFSNLSRVGSTTKLHGASMGQPAWTGNPSWNTDGKILLFTR